MFIEKKIITRSHVRFRGDTGHKLRRQTAAYLFRCDSCGCQFSRTSKQIKKKQLQEGVLHACPSCQGPEFASKASALRRKALSADASSEDRIDQLR